MTHNDQPTLVRIDGEPTAEGAYLCRPVNQYTLNYVEVYREWHGHMYAREAFSRTAVALDSIEGEWWELIPPKGMSINR